MSQVNAITDSNGRMSYFANGGDGFRVGLGGHGSVDINYAEIVDFNFSQQESVSVLASDGGKLKNIHLMLCDLGIVGNDDSHHLSIDLLKMGKVKTNKFGAKYCPNPRFVGVEVTLGKASVKVVAGSGVSFYIFNSNVYRSSSAVKRAIKNG